MDDNKLLQYSRQIMLPEIGVDGQQRLLDAKVLLIGVGGLGSPIAMYLAAAGIGEITLVDFDTVDLSNLQRQIIHRMNSIGRLKTDSAKHTLLELNPDCKVNTITELLDEPGIRHQIKAHDVVIDATDNFTTRFLINQYCVAEQTPLVSGAAIRWEGQISTFTNEPGTPCYHCLYGQDGDEDESCTENGVLAPVVGIIGSMQATEAIKLICNAGSTLESRLLILDALQMQWRSMKIKPDPQCSVCQKQ
ncbi:MAG: molybdopterin-synthase adenylyltransferase MoeB [Gammaproteobacteria bacterium]|nr:molybdopterin-synthase adenylyltransferase MoeB [Gammaproteobacteria bacterium]NNJ90456.1 molybdopterin-synthase adenylyltransferase MoeB [Gammaproteobacteria bacterium]